MLPNPSHDDKIIHQQVTTTISRFLQLPTKGDPSVDDFLNLNEYEKRTFRMTGALKQN